MSDSMVMIKKEDLETITLLLQKSEAALRFYADAPNYALTRDERGMEITPIFIDAGKRARAVLEDK